MSEEQKEDIKNEYSRRGYAYTTFKKTCGFHECFDIKYPRFLSFTIGARKFYPLAKLELAKEKIFRKLKKKTEYAFVEIYCQNKIYYYAPKENFEDFYLTKYPTPEKN